MEILVASSVGVLIAAGIYRLLGSTKVDIIVGLILLSQGANLIIFASGGLKQNSAAIVAEEQASYEHFADPLPQALVLTAIVIGFGILAFVLTLLTRYNTDES